jgi:hypothetical protein
MIATSYRVPVATILRFASEAAQAAFEAHQQAGITPNADSALIFILQLRTDSPDSFDSPQSDEYDLLAIGNSSAQMKTFTGRYDADLRKLQGCAK